jgi:hypothetical protein
VRIFRPILLTLCTIVVALLVLLWARSLLVCDVVTRDGASGRHYELLLLANQIRFTVVDGWPVRQPPHCFQTSLPGYPVYGQSVLRLSYWRLGFATETGTKTFFSPGRAFFPLQGWSASTTYRLYAVPIPVVIIVFAAYPAWEVFVARRRRLRREYRLAHGHCLHCGYDLRASSGRCPECGRVSRGSDPIATLPPSPI